MNLSISLISSLDTLYIMDLKVARLKKKNKFLIKKIRKNL